MQNKQDLSKPQTNGEKSDSLVKNLGDKVERFGEKVSSAGAPKVGEAIKNLGDKIEHAQDKK